MRPSGRSSRAGLRKCRTYLKCCSGRLWSSVVTGVAAASWPCMGVPPIACRGMGGSSIHLRSCRGPENRPVLGGQARNQPGTAGRDRVVHDHGHYDYRVGLPSTGVWREMINRDAADYGGSGVGNMGQVEATGEPWHGRPASAVLTVPPLGVLWLVHDPTPAPPPPPPGGPAHPEARSMITDTFPPMSHLGSSDCRNA